MIRILCLTEDDPNLRIDRIAFNYGRGYQHSRMWDRYARQHTGVCLVFDKERLTAAVQRELEGVGAVLHGPVSYGEMFPADVFAFNLKTSTLREHGEEEALLRHRDRHARALYFIKSSVGQRGRVPVRAVVEPRPALRVRRYSGFLVGGDRRLG